MRKKAMENNSSLPRLTSPKPDSGFLMALRRYMDLLESSRHPITMVESKMHRKRGDAEAIVEELRRHLLIDYDESLSESLVEGYNFEYVLEPDPEHRNALHVLTRLFSSGAPGSIYYGSIVLREGPDEFSLWTDPS